MFEHKFELMFNYIMWFLVLLLLPFAHSEPISEKQDLAANCYSRCNGCQKFPANCSMCSSSLILVNNQCVTNSRQSILSEQFFPIEPSNPFTTISHRNISNAPYIIENCTFSLEGSTAPFYFISPSSSFTRYFSKDELPTHSYINIMFVYLMKDWINSVDGVTVIVNGENVITFSYGGFNIADLGALKCGNSTIEIKNFEFMTPDSNSTLNFTLKPQLFGKARYGFNSLLIRYGNCDKSCQTCKGSTSNKCTSCRSFLIWKNSICDTCSPEYFYNDSACWRCHYTCKTCRGFSENECLSCDDATYNLTNGKCIPIAKYFEEVAHDFKEIVFTSNYGWKVSTAGDAGSDISVCGRYSYLGGYQIGSSTTYISKVFTNLATHYAARIQFLLIVIDEQSHNISYLFQIDNEVNNEFTPVSGTTTNQCGTSRQESLHLIQINNIPHTNPSLKFRLRPDISNASNYGMRDFLLFLYKCSPGCRDCSEDPNMCKQCGGNLLLQGGECKNCAPGYYQTSDQNCNPCNILCKQCTGPLANQCKSCDKPLILSGTQCIQDAGYQIYGVYLNQKTDRVNPTDNWNIYPNLQNRGNDKCGNRSMLGNSQLRYKSLMMSRSFDDLPKHTALSIHFNVIQIDEFSPRTLSFVYDGIEVKYSPANFGIRICGNNTRDAMTKVTYSTSHTTNVFSFEVRVHQIAKLGIANMIIFLKDCAKCKGQLEYHIDYMPVYDSHKRGLNIWIDFNYKNKNLSEVTNIFAAALGPNSTDKKSRLLAQVLPFNYSVQSVRRDSYKLFTRLNQSLFDTYLKINTNSPSLILSNNNQEEGVQKPLITTNSMKYLTRYDILTSNKTRRTMNNMYNFNYGFTNAVFYINLVMFALGMAVLLQDFVHLLQVVFLYVYIESAILPFTLKYPLGGMKRIQFLNFFSQAHRKSIQTWFLPKDFYQNSHHVFEQYQPDVNFLRAIYALIIFNLFYVLFWVIGSILLKNVKVLRDKSYNPYLRYFQDLWARPFAFFDSLLRYQFIAIVWAALLQFTHFTSPYVPYSGINAFFTVAFFAAFLAYPIGKFLYLKTQYSYMTNDQFQFLYSDCFYKRIAIEQSPQQNPHPFIYPIFKNYVFLLICIAICLSAFYETPLIALIPLLVLLCLDTVWIFVFKIFNEPVLKGFKIVENILLILLTILYFVVDGQAASMPTDQFLQLGFGCEAAVIMLVISSSMRAVYLLYLRSLEFREFKHQLKMSAIENSHVNDAEKQLLKSRSRLLGSKIAASSNIILPSNKKTIKSMIRDQSQLGSKVTSLNKFVE